MGANGWVANGAVADFLEDEYIKEGAICFTVGYVLEQNKERVVLLQSLAEDEQGNLWVIPTKMIKAMAILRQPKKATKSTKSTTVVNSARTIEHG